MNCLKRFPLVSFPRHYTSTTSALSVSAGDVISRNTKRKPPAEKKENPTLEIPTRPNLLEWTSVQAHLDELSETNGKLVLADIERCRPQQIPASDTEEYKKQYRALLQRLTDAFTAKQLRQFLTLYEMGKPPGSRKEDYAVAIMEDQWRWPALRAIQEREREQMEGVKSFPLNPAQAFLILGKNGSHFQFLARTYNVRMTYSGSPLSLEVKGFVGALNKIEKHLNELKEAIVEDVIEFPNSKPISPRLLRRISRESGALTENFGQGKLRITFLQDKLRTAVIARRLAARAVCEEIPTKQNRVLCHIPPAVPSSTPLPISMVSHAYSLYPFLSHQSMPWMMSARSVFRLRRVEEWLAANATEDTQKTGGLSMGRGRLMTLQEQPTDLRAVLLSDYPKSPLTSRVVHATTGHLLLASPLSNRVDIAPPLQGQCQITTILQWMNNCDQRNRVFTPSLPSAFLHSQPSQQRVLHRLIYHGIDVAEGLQMIKLELVLPDLTIKTAISPELSTDDSQSVIPSFDTKCWIGQKVDTDVMMPDRTMDIQFSTFDSVLLPKQQWPLELQTHTYNLKAFLTYQDRNASQPDNPLTFVYEGITYMLHSSCAVRQNVESLSPESSVRVVSESILDLDGAHKSTLCQVTCEDIVADDEWTSFLHHCDKISSTKASNQPRTPMGDIDI